MLKKIILFYSLIVFGPHLHAAQPQPAPAARPLARPAAPAPITFHLDKIPAVPINFELNVAPTTLVSGLGFAGCLAALELYKQGAKLTACQDTDPVIQKAKHDEGNALINKSYILFAASAAAIFNKQIIHIFIK